MKIFQKLLSLVLVSLLLGGCTLTGAVPVAAGSAGESSSAAESNTASVRPQNKPNASSRAEEDKSSSREEETSSPPSSSAAITPADAAKETEALTALLTALQRTGADEAAREQAQQFADSAGALPQSVLAVRGIFGLCTAPQKTAGLSEQITAAAQESGLPREAFRLAAAACRERGRNTKDSVTITFTGDCTFSPINEESHSSSFDQVYARQSSPSYPFDRMFPWFATDDITCINFEGTLTKSLAHAEKTYYFRGDPSLARILPSSSVEVANLANNHTMDYFQRGFDDTRNALTGAGVSLITVQQPYVTAVNGIEVVLIGQQMASGANAAVKTVKQYKREDNIVIVVMHWSTEFSDQAAPVCVEAGHRLIDAGADLVVGHHPHVLQGVELYRNKYIVYSLGNFAFGANVGPVTSPYTMAFRARFVQKEGKAILEDAGIIPCCPTSDASGWNNYQPKPLFGQEARELADYVVSISSSLPYGVKELSYFDI
ncbi:MAG: CapA family protein [Firmicutes bacterium]|nr:CapA family protein [Bacillota bacterium]